jgi:N-acetylmuramoyl-L-alanine amidase
VFKDRIIAVDPGHSLGSPGAIGPRGTYELDANWSIAKDLEALLIKEGAKVVLTHGGRENEAGLLDRQRLAWGQKAELFVSVHNNALPDGENPFDRPHGYSVFYYHPHSMSLAKQVYQAYEREIPLPGEGLRYGNLFVARATQMPSILTESAYMMFPDQEDFLLVPSRRRRISAAIVDGMRRFLEAQRARQKRTP